jgi:aldose 1-epimerase
MTILKLASDKLRLTVTPERGCHWTSLDINVGGAWRGLLEPGEGFGGGSYMMAPWCNRVRGAAFSHAGRHYKLWPTFFDGSAIHGDVHARPWRLRTVDRSSFLAELETLVFPDFNFPFPLSFSYAVHLQGARLRTDVMITNRHNTPVPVGFGFHPFFKRRLTDDDKDVEVVLPAEEVYPIKLGVPTGPAVGVKDKYDLRKARPLGDPDFDDNFTRWGGRPIELIYRGTGVRARLEADAIFDHCFVFAPTDKKFVAIEPMTMASAGLNLAAEGWEDTGLKLLEPGETWGGGISLSYERL